jgi:SDR family mycofactocin-dependent oxidoreductase
MGRVEGKVAFVTGAARGQGRSHALRLAEEGANIIAIDICGQVETVPYAMSTLDDLNETVRAVEALDRRIVARQGDVRDYAALEGALDAGISELGSLDIVIANAGIGSYATAEKLTEQEWRDVLDVDLTGVWLTCKAAIPRMADGGVIILTSSTMGLKTVPNAAHYNAAKHGVVGLMRTLAQELAPRRIRVNSIHPTQVGTDMILNQGMYDMFRPDLEHPTRDDFAEASAATLLLNHVAWIEPRDVSNSVLFLASEEARFITGVTLPIDAGFLVK